MDPEARKVIEMGYVDPKKIGINGHSYGGEGVAFIGTRSRLFAAIGMGAGVTDLYQDFNQNWGWAYQVLPYMGYREVWEETYVALHCS